MPPPERPHGVRLPSPDGARRLQRALPGQRLREPGERLGEVLGQPERRVPPQPERQQRQLRESRRPAWECERSGPRSAWAAG
jgi:hypothetical protein